MTRDIGLVFVRSVRPTLRNPVVIVIGLSQPLLYLLLFGPLLGGIGQRPSGQGSSWQWFVPGIMVQMALFGTAYAGFALIPEIRSGALERLRVTPVSRTALLLGRVLRDVVLLVVQCTLIAVVSLLLGFRTAPGPLLGALALIAVVGVAVGSASYALALILKQEYAFAPALTSTVIPVMLLSGVLLPMTLAPAWLHDIALVNPLSHVVDAERAIIAGQWGLTAVWLGPLLAVVLAVAGAAWGARTFRRQQA
ncbi:MAG TPA: ABC transporter permease [Pseudonocardiaceae bacterium]|nr:ABC transporter permease [Pseudonocardiaceae bacterium]